MLRGAIDPKESPVYEYVRFIGNFKSLNNGTALKFHSACSAGRRHVTRPVQGNRTILTVALFQFPTSGGMA